MKCNKKLIVMFALISCASLYYLQATDSKLEKSSYAQFTASYESLFGEKPAALWINDDPSCWNCSFGD